MSDSARWQSTRSAAARVAQLVTANQQRRTRRTMLLLRRKFDPPHGSLAAYHRGGGCDPCVRVNSDASRARRRREHYREDA